MPKHNGHFYCLKCLHSFATKNNCEPHKKVCKNKDFVMLMSLEHTKILELNQYHKSDKVFFIIYAYPEIFNRKD